MVFRLVLFGAYGANIGLVRLINRIFGRQGGYVLWSFFFFSSRRRHTRCSRDWSSDVCSSDLFSMRKWICDWIVNVKNPQSRVRRAEQVAEQLLSTMEAELDLPPILKRAFASDPRAYQGWQTMTPLQRRSHLLGIFYYRSPESRDRRITKMLEDASAHAERKSRSKAGPKEVARDGIL